MSSINMEGVQTDPSVLAYQMIQATTDLSNGKKPANHRELLCAARNLTRALEGPEACLVNLAKAPVGYSVLVTAIDIELFQSLRTDPVHVKQLAGDCNVEQSLLERLMRVLVCHGIFDCVGPQCYSQTALSKALKNPGVAAVVRGLADTASILPSLPLYLSSIGYVDPTSEQSGFFRYAKETPLNMFEWMEEHPLQLKIFQDFQSAKDKMAGPQLKKRWKKIIEDEIVRYQTGADEENAGDHPTFLCDVGGGRGEQLKEAWLAIVDEKASLDGRVVTQDLPKVVQGLENTNGWDPMPHDFFSEQPVKGACLYHFRDVLHNWSDASCQRILANTKAAMCLHSRIMIAESIVPTMDTPLFLANTDISMMQFGGRERTEEDWTQLLQTAGLHLESIEYPEGGRPQEALILAVTSE